jgi:GDP-D-mannose dehydratase
MPSTRVEVFAAIDRERLHQKRKWGHVEHSVQAWLLVVEEELAEAKRDWVRTGKDEAALRELVQVAACAVAALEEHGVFEREVSRDD